MEERGWAYQRRPPEGTVLYEAVGDNLATLLAEARELGRGLPRYVGRVISLWQSSTPPLHRTGRPTPPLVGAISRRWVARSRRASTASGGALPEAIRRGCCGRRGWRSEGRAATVEIIDPGRLGRQ